MTGTILKIAGTGVLLALLLALVPAADYRRVLADLDPLLALASLAVLLPMALLKAANIRLMARSQGLDFTYARMVEIQLATGFWGLAVPGQVGATLARWHKLQQPAGAAMAAAAVVAFARLVEWTTALALALALATVDPRNAGAAALLGLLALALLLPLAAVALLARGRARLARRLPALALALDRFARLSRRRLLAIAGLDLAWHLVAVLGAVLAARALGIDLSWLTLGWLTTAAGIVLALPLSWGGIGLREAGLAALLQPLGVGLAEAVALGLLISLRAVVEAVLGGLVELRALLASQRPWRHRPPAGRPATLDAGRRTG